MAIFDIAIYAFFAWAMHRLAKRFATNSPDGTWNDNLTGFVAFFSVVCAIRFNVGVDCLSYIKIFHENWITEDRVLIWNGIVSALHALGLHYAFGLGIMAFIQILFITLAVRRTPYVLLALPIVLFGNRYFMDLTGAVRQMTAACIFLWGSKFIAERKLLPYVAVVWACSLIHFSSWILLPLYLLRNSFTLADKRKWMLVVFACCFVAGQTPSFQRYANDAAAFATMIGYEGYAQRVSNFLEEGQTAEALTFGPMMLSYLLVAVFSICYGPTLKKRYEDKIPCFNIWYNLGYFYACAYFLVCNVSHLFIRPVQYLELFQMVVVSLLLYDLGFSRHRRQLPFLALLFSIWLNTSWEMIKASGSENEHSTYKVFFMHLDQEKQLFSHPVH